MAFAKIFYKSQKHNYYNLGGFLQNGDLEQQKKEPLFKDLLKKTIKIIYLSLILPFCHYFYSLDSLTHRKLSVPLCVEQLLSYYIDRPLEMSRYCCPREIF